MALGREKKKQTHTKVNREIQVGRERDGWRESKKENQIFSLLYTKDQKKINLCVGPGNGHFSLEGNLIKMNEEHTNTETHAHIHIHVYTSC